MKSFQFYSQAFLSNDTNKLIEIANQITTEYRQQSKQLRQVIPQFSYQVLQMNLIDNISIISNVSNTPKYPFKIPTFLKLLFFAPSLSKDPINPGRSAITCFNFMFSWKPFLQNALNCLTLDPKYHTPIGTYLTSSIHLFAHRSTLNIKHLSIIDGIFSSIITGTINYGGVLLSNFLKKYFPIVPSFVFDSIVPMAFQSVLFNIQTYGLASTLNKAIEACITKILPDDELPELPLEVDIPDPMTCCICHGLLNKPCEVLGFFFCKKCINSWIYSRKKNGQNPIHPVTGETINESMINQSSILDLLCVRYHQLALAHINNMQPMRN